MRKSLFIVSLLFIVMLPISARVQNSSGATYEVYALSYGVYPSFPVSALLAGADKDRKIDLQMMIWLVKGPGGRNILVDTGCYHEHVVKGKGIKNLIKASEAIAKLGLAATDITDVIITHMHWDHADGMDLFPNAKIWIQKDEYVYYTGLAWQSDGKAWGYRTRRRPDARETQYGSSSEPGRWRQCRDHRRDQSLHGWAPHLRVAIRRRAHDEWHHRDRFRQTCISTRISRSTHRLRRLSIPIQISRLRIE